MKKVKVRFAPSPTGYLHIGGLRTALFNYLYARHSGGSFVLRIEDTDRTRYVEGALENLLSVLDWAQLERDEGPALLADGTIRERGEYGPYIQSERVKEGIYDRYAQQLIEEGKAYYCFCSEERLDQVRAAQKARGETPRYDEHCRNIPLKEAKRRVAEGEAHVIRMKLPHHEDLTFHDQIKGDITINTDEMDDQVLIKTDGFPTYHFAVVCDDHLMGVTHIVRGEEWISSTPKHMLLYRMLGWPEPVYVHLPNVLGQDGKKLSKRNGDASVEGYIEKGYPPEAVLNYIALLGWSPEGNQEVMSKEELIRQFDFDRVSAAPGVFDLKKLNYISQEHIKRFPLEKAASYVRAYLERAGLVDESYPEEKIRLLTATYQNRIQHFDQLPEMTCQLFVPASELEYEEAAVEAIRSEEGQEVIRAFEDLLNQEGFSEDFARKGVKKIQEETGIKGKKLWFPIRAAVVGQTSGPDFGNTLLILGEGEVRARLKRVEEEEFLAGLPEKESLE